MPEPRKFIVVANVDEEGRFGGPEKRITLVAKTLNGKGIKTIVVVPRLDSQSFCSYLSKNDVEFLKVDITRLSLERRILFRYLIRFPLEVWILLKTIKKICPDIVHVNGASQFKVAIASWLAGKKVVWHLNNTFLKPPVKFVFHFLSYFLTDGVIFAGSRAGKYYNVNKRFKSLPKFNIEAPVSKEFYGIPFRSTTTDRLEIVAVGGVNSAKGIDDLIRVAGVLQEKGINFRIRVAGKILPSQQVYYEECLAIIQELSISRSSLEFLGEVDDIPQLLSSADIALTMSRREASPTAVWEGLAAGRIVVTTDVGSVKDHISSGENGFIVDIGDYKAAAEAIESIFQGNSSLVNMRKLARRRAVEAFSTESISQLHSEIYRMVQSK